MNIATDTVQQRIAGEQPARTRSLLTALMIGAALVAGRWGVAAERKSLEAVARPLSESE